MKTRVYIDTSVIGGCFDKEFSQWSIQLFDEFKAGNKIAVFSDITLDELELARAEIRNLMQLIPKRNIEYLLRDQETIELADAYIMEKVVSRKFYEDALHIAIATVNKVDVLVS